MSAKVVAMVLAGLLWLGVGGAGFAGLWVVAWGLGVAVRAFRWGAGW